MSRGKSSLSVSYNIVLETRIYFRGIFFALIGLEDASDAACGGNVLTRLEFLGRRLWRVVGRAGETDRVV